MDGGYTIEPSSHLQYQKRATRSYHDSSEVDWLLTSGENRHDGDQHKRRRRRCQRLFERESSEEEDGCETKQSRQTLHPHLQSIELNVRTALLIFSVLVGMIVMFVGCMIIRRSQNSADGVTNYWREKTDEIEVSVLHSISSSFRVNQSLHNTTRVKNKKGSRSNKFEDTCESFIVQLVVVYVDVDDGQREMAKYVALGAQSHNDNGNGDGNGIDDDSSSNSHNNNCNRANVNVTFIAIEDLFSDGQILDDDDHIISTVLMADAIVLGSPVYNANIHPSLLQWIDVDWNLPDFWQNDDMATTATSSKLRVGGAFVTAGGITAGGESTLQQLLHILMTFHFVVVGGPDWTSSFGAAAVTAEDPFIVGTTQQSISSSSNTTTSTSSSSDLSQRTVDGDNETYFPDLSHQQKVGGGSSTSSTTATNHIHPMFLDKAYGLGKHIATVSRRLKYGGLYCSCLSAESKLL